MQSLVWGTSWRAYVPPIEGLFHTAIKEEKSENFGLYLYRAGLLMDDAGQEIAEKFFVEAQRLAPKDPEVAANLASYYVVRLRAAEARPLAQLSLSVNPRQAHVLIDLASAEWLLGDLDNALVHSNQAAELDPSLPGPHVTLVLVHLARGENAEALKEAEQGVQLSERHFYYLAAQAIAYEAAGKPELAVKNVREAWNGEYPDEGTLRKLFLKDKPLELLLRVIKRAKA